MCSIISSQAVFKCSFIVENNPRVYHSIKDKYPQFFPLSLSLSVSVSKTQLCDFGEKTKNYSYNGITNARTNQLKALTIPSCTLFFSLSFSLTNTKSHSAVMH